MGQELGGGGVAYPPLVQPSGIQVSLWVIISPVLHLLLAQACMGSLHSHQKAKEPTEPRALSRWVPMVSPAASPSPQLDAEILLGPGPISSRRRGEEEGGLRVSQLQPLAPSPQPTNFLPFLGVVGHTYLVPSPRQALHPTSARIKIHCAGYFRYFISFTSYSFNPWLNSKGHRLRKAARARRIQTVQPVQSALSPSHLTSLSGSRGFTGVSRFLAIISPFSVNCECIGEAPVLSWKVEAGGPNNMPQPSELMPSAQTGLAILNLPSNIFWLKFEAR